MNATKMIRMSLPPARVVDLRLGPYSPCFEVGSGGMASVYVAREDSSHGLERTVALKVMHEHLARQGDFKRRFLDEARVLMQIQHPYVCRVVGYGEEEGYPYLAMEYLIGEPLSRVFGALRRRSELLSPTHRARLFARVVADLAEGLHAAHEARDSSGRSLSIVHRDISPQNLFVLYDGTVRVVDFGIANFANRQVRTVTSGLFGKPPYLAPEQIEGNEYDRRADIWALGVVLWELVTLSYLFRRETRVRTMRAVTEEPIPSVDEYAEGLPPGLDAILRTALQRDVDKRYATARDFARALEQWLSRTGGPVSHAELGEFLTDFFPGSQSERRRWATESGPRRGSRSGTRARPRQLDAEEDPRTQDLSFEFSLPQARGHFGAGSSAGRSAPRSRDAQLSVTRRSAAPEPLPTTRDESRSFRGPGNEDKTVAVEPELTVPRRAVARRRSKLGGGWIALIGVASVIGVLSAGGWLHIGAAPAVEATALAAPLEGPASGPMQAPVGAVNRVPGAAADVLVPNTTTSDATKAEMAIAEVPMVPVPVAEVPVAEVPGPPLTEPHGMQPTAGTAPAPVQPQLAPVPRSDAAQKLTTPAPASKSGSGVDASKNRAHATLATVGTADSMIVSDPPGVRVYLAERLLGTTPLRAKLPIGVITLGVQTRTGRTPIRTRVAAGRLNVVSVNANQ